MAHRRLWFSTSALVIAVSSGFAAAAVRPHGSPQLPNGAVAVTEIDGIPVGVALPLLPPRRVGNPAGASAPFETARATYNSLSNDRNAEFLSWYGFQLYDDAQSTCSDGNCTYSSGYERLAIPIAGEGLDVSKIQVPNSQVTGKGARFTVALYANSPSNTPGNPLPNASGTASAVNSSYCCSELLTVKIPRTTLSAGTTYWIVENGAKQTGVSNSIFWLGETTNFTKAGGVLMQYHQYVAYDGFVEVDYTSPWQASTGDQWTEPAAKVN
jgi:hypothetical protein